MHRWDFWIEIQKAPQVRKNESALLVSEDFNEERAQKAGGLSLVPLKHKINLNFDLCDRKCRPFSSKLHLQRRLLSTLWRYEDGMVKGWDWIRVMEIGCGWSKQNLLLLLLFKLQSGSNFGQLRKIASRCTGSKLTERAKKSLWMS